jgi:hypothetical protein
LCVAYEKFVIVDDSFLGQVDGPDLCKHIPWYLS